LVHLLKAALAMVPSVNSLPVMLTGTHSPSSMQTEPALRPALALKLLAMPCSALLQAAAVLARPLLAASVVQVV
jgi:hypothetical protein